MKSDYKNLNLNCSLDLPYPQIEVCKKNIDYANLIKVNYCGMVSELTAVAQYTYHELITDDYVKNTLRGIVIVEMHHLEIIGELISALGGNPTFSIKKKGKDFHWNSKFINTDNSLKKLLISDISMEKESIKQYRKTASVVKDENIIAIINRIILDEEHHINLLNRLYERELGN
ncbi:ferritin family protein [Clostridium sp. MB05]|jgi:bacterioferritin